MGQEQFEADRIKPDVKAMQAEPPKRSMPTSIGYKLRRLQLAYNRNFQRMCEGIDIPTNQIGALSLITRNPEITPSELAATLTLDAAQVTPIIKQLEARGLVERRRSKRDSRSHKLRSTALGASEYERMRALIARFEADFLGAVLEDDEIRQFYTLLDRLQTAAQAALERGD